MKTLIASTLAATLGLSAASALAAHPRQHESHGM